MAAMKCGHIRGELGGRTGVNRRKPAGMREILAHLLRIGQNRRDLAGMGEEIPEFGTNRSKSTTADPHWRASPGNDPFWPNVAKAGRFPASFA